MQRLAKNFRVTALTFIVVFTIIFLAVFMGWADKPINAWLETTLRDDMGWFDRTLWKYSGPESLIDELRRDNFGVFTRLSFWLGLYGAFAVSFTTLIIRKLLSYFDNSKH